MSPQDRILDLIDLNGSQILGNGKLINLIMDNNPIAVANNVKNLTGAKGDISKTDIINFWEQLYKQGKIAEAWSIFDVPYLAGNGIQSDDDAAAQTLISLAKSAPRPQMLDTNGGPAGGAPAGSGSFDWGSVVNGLLNNASGIIGAITGAVNGSPTQTPGTQTQAPAPQPAADNTSKYLMYGGIGLVAVAAIAIAVAAFRKKKS